MDYGLRVVIFSTRPGLRLRLAAVKIADTLGCCGSAFPNSPLCFRTEHMLPPSSLLVVATLVARFRLAYFTFHLMISYFFKVGLFQFFAALCFNRHLLTFWILACLHTARNAPWKWMHLIFFVPTSCVSGADRKLIFASENFVCVYMQTRVCLSTNRVHL